MTNHYYAHKPDTQSNVSEYVININNVEFRFLSDSGVFSKQAADFGSTLLINTLIQKEDMPLGLSNEEKPSLVDLGCGNGLIGITLARLLKVNNTHMYDINERAIQLANENIKLNKSKRTYAKVLDIVEDFSDIEHAQLCVCNPPIRAGKKVVFAFYEAAFALLTKGGTFYCVIQKKQGAESSIKKLNDLFGNCEVVQRSSGYRILRAVKN